MNANNKFANDADVSSVRANIEDVHPLDDRVIGKVLARRAASIGDRVWMVSGDGTARSGGAARRGARLARRRPDVALSKGQTLALVPYPSIDAILIGLAVTRLGGI